MGEARRYKKREQERNRQKRQEGFSRLSPRMEKPLEISITVKQEHRTTKNGGRGGKRGKA